MPDVNQIQLSPTLTRTAARAFHARHGIVTESWSPLGGAGAAVVRNPVITGLARQYGRSPAQIVLRWHLELGLVAIPKSSTPDRLRQNLDVFDFTLAPADIAAISALDESESGAADSDAFGH